MESKSTTIPHGMTHWWVYLLAGILLLMLGLGMYTYPGDAYLGLSVYFAAIMLVNGLSGVVFAASNRATMRGWGWLVVLGLGEAALGAYLLARPALAAGTLAGLIGFWVMYRSAITISNAFMLRQLGQPNWGWVLGLGLLGSLIAVLILAAPGLGALGAVVWVATALLTLGAASCVLAFRLRRAHL